MFDKSPVSKKLFKHFNKKFGQIVTPKALCKCCAVVSCKLESPRVSIFDVAPTRSLKTYTSKDVIDIFDSDFWLNMKSDFQKNLNPPFF